MTPPEAPVQSPEGSASVMQSAIVVIDVLARRSDFVRAAKAHRQGTGSFLLQARRRQPDEGTDPHSIRIGYTCSKKIGNAVRRNRAKRRLREIARHVLPLHGQAGWDYVLVGRPDATVTREFATMLTELERALAKIHGAET